MIQIAALDDDRVWIDKERQITEKVMAGMEYRFHAYTNVKHFLEEINKKEFDVFLLDMVMPEMNGLEIARRVKKIQYDAVVIYVTNYVEYAVEAYEVNAYRYIPKQLLEIKLPEAYRAVQDRLIGRKERYFTYITDSHLEKIPESQIYYLVKEKKYVLITHRKGQIKVRSSMEAMLCRLKSKSFLQIDKGCVVNIPHVMCFERQQIQMRDGVYFSVSQPRIKEVKQKIACYWGNEV